MSETTAWTAGGVFAGEGEHSGAVPVYLVRSGADLASLGLDSHVSAWAEINRFKGSAKSSLLVPGSDG